MSKIISIVGHPLSFILPTLRYMKLVMLPLGKKLKVLNTVIVHGSVNMMNNLARIKKSSKFLLHYEPMLPNIVIFRGKRVVGLPNMSVPVTTSPFTSLPKMVFGAYTPNRISFSGFRHLLNSFRKVLPPPSSLCTQLPHTPLRTGFSLPVFKWAFPDIKFLATVEAFHHVGESFKPRWIFLEENLLDKDAFIWRCHTPNLSSLIGGVKYV